MINILVCDDQEEWCEIISTYVSIFMKKKKLRYNLNSLHTKTFHDLEQHIESGAVDIAFLDIDLIGLNYNGLELAKKLKERNEDIVIIFVTSYQEYAMESYKINGFGYMLKPVTPSALNAKLTQALIYLNGIHMAKSKLIKLGQVEIVQKYIVSIETEGRNLRVSTTKRVIITSYVPLSNVINTLPSHFILVSRSVIINTQYIVSYDKKAVYLLNDRIYWFPVRKRNMLYKQLQEMRVK